MGAIKRFAIPFTIGALFSGSDTLANEKLQGVVVIETRILPFDPVSGMKSTQRISIFYNSVTKSIRLAGSFKTGKTFGVIPSIRNKFTFETTLNDVPRKKLNFKVTGQTASGIVVLGNIDYKLNFKFSWANKRNVWNITGCHDAYPAYKVWVENAISGKTTNLYSFKHEKVNLGALYGECDIQVNVASDLPD